MTDDLERLLGDNGRAQGLGVSKSLGLGLDEKAMETVGQWRFKPDAGFISVDVTELGIHDAVHVSQIALPNGVEAVFDDDFAVVTVIQPSVEETRGAAAEGAEGAAAAPEAAKAKEGAAS